MPTGDSVDIFLRMLGFENNLEKDMVKREANQILKKDYT